MMTACIIATSPNGGDTPPYGPPVAMWEASETFVSPYTTVYFNDVSTGTPTSWRWKLNGITFAITQNTQYYFTIDGTYAITLEATNEYGTDSYTDVIYVSSV